MINIGILNSNIGNLRSLLQVFKNLPILYNIFIVNNSSDLFKVDRLILPGQGSIFSCLSYLRQNFSIHNLFNFIYNKPTLGICIGKHLFFEKSEESISNFNSLGLFSGFIKKFNNKKNIKVPHIGWNKVRFIKNHVLFNNVLNLGYFYFAHSFYSLPIQSEFIYGVTNYHLIFSSIVIKNNIVLFQFHPEKSSYLGMRLIYNFSLWSV